MKSNGRHTLSEAADRCGVTVAVIVRFLGFEWITPTDEHKQSLDEEDLARARLIWELQNDFGVNDEAIPIILNLLDQLNRTQFELKRMG